MHNKYVSLHFTLYTLIHIWLVADQPLWKILVKWDYYLSIYRKIKIMFQSTNQISNQRDDSLAKPQPHDMIIESSAWMHISKRTWARLAGKPDETSLESPRDSAIAESFLTISLKVSTDWLRYTENIPSKKTTKHRWKCRFFVKKTVFTPKNMAFQIHAFFKKCFAHCLEKSNAQTGLTWQHFCYTAIMALFVSRSRFLFKHSSREIGANNQYFGYGHSRGNYRLYGINTGYLNGTHIFLERTSVFTLKLCLSWTRYNMIHSSIDISLNRPMNPFHDPAISGYLWTML